MTTPIAMMVTARTLSVWRAEVRTPTTRSVAISHNRRVEHEHDAGVFDSRQRCPIAGAFCYRAIAGVSPIVRGQLGREVSALSRRSRAPRPRDG